MILLQLRANFGKLHGTLTLHEGLNELCAIKALKRLL